MFEDCATHHFHGIGRITYFDAKVYDGLLHSVQWGFGTRSVRTQFSFKTALARSGGTKIEDRIMFRSLDRSCTANHNSHSLSTEDEKRRVSIYLPLLAMTNVVPPEIQRP